MNSFVLFRLGGGWLLMLVAAAFLLYAYLRSRDWGLLCLWLAVVSFLLGHFFHELAMELMLRGTRSAYASAFGYDLHLSRTHESALPERSAFYPLGTLLRNVAAPVLALVASIRFAFMHRKPGAR